MLYFIAISHHIAVIVDTVLFQKDILSILVSSGMHVYSGPPPNHQCPLKPLRLQVQLGPWRQQLALEMDHLWPGDLGWEQCVSTQMAKPLAAVFRPYPFHRASYQGSIQAPLDLML